MEKDVFKILKDLEYKAVGVDPKTKKMQEGYFVSFRNIGLPIPEEDYRNPWTPTGAEMKKIISDAKNAATPPNKGATPDGTGAVTEPTALSDDIKELMKELKIAGIGESMMNYVSTFYLTNQKLTMSPEYTVMPGAGHIDDAWYAIINGAHGIPSKTEVSNAIKKALEDAKAKLMDKDGNPTTMYSNYNTYRDAYLDKVKSLNRNFADAMSDPVAFRNWPINGKLYQDDVNKAWNEWQSFGNKPEVEKAISTLAAQGQDPAILLINRAKQKWENSLINFDKIGVIPYTFMSPRKWYSPDSDGWMRYDKVDRQYNSNFTSNTTSIGAAGGFSLGFFSIGGSGGSKTTRTNMDLKATNLEITFQYSIADIYRPWLDINLLNLQNWFLVGDYKKHCISTGKFGQELARASNKTIFLPSVVTSIILVKDLKIKWSEMNQHRATLDKAINGGATVGIGPFMVGGSYASRSKESQFSSNYTSEGLSCKGVQLVGYVSTILPASPQVDSKEFMQLIQPPQPA